MSRRCWPDSDTLPVPGLAPKDAFADAASEVRWCPDWLSRAVGVLATNRPCQDNDGIHARTGARISQFSLTRMFEYAVTLYRSCDWNAIVPGPIFRPGVS